MASSGEVAALQPSEYSSLFKCVSVCLSVLGYRRNIAMHHGTMAPAPHVDIVIENLRESGVPKLAESCTVYFLHHLFTEGRQFMKCLKQSFSA